MRSFKDKNGKEWVLDLTVGDVSRIKATSRFNLFDAEILREVYLDELVSYELLWKIVEPVATAQNVSEPEFGKSIAAFSLYDARQALLEELRDFFQNLQKPEVVELLEKMVKWHKAALDQWKTKLAGFDLDTKVETAISEQLNVAFGHLEDSLASIPESTRGDNSSGSPKVSAR